MAKGLLYSLREAVDAGTHVDGVDYQPDWVRAGIMTGAATGRPATGHSPLAINAF